MLRFWFLTLIVFAYFIQIIFFNNNPELTELLYSPVGTPRQLQGDVNSSPLVLDSAVALQGDARRGSLGYHRY